MKNLSWLTAALLFTLFGPFAMAQGAGTPEAICADNVPASDPATRTYSSTEPVLEADVDYRAIFCTAAGPIYIDLFEQFTPVTVNNFVFLAQQGYYNNTSFHRVIESFMVQGGDPDGTGAGGPDYTFEDEFVGFLHFDRPGWLAMANRGANTNGSQFFITTGTASHLDYQHTIFGEVLEGQEIVESIDLRDPETATEPGTALNTVVIITDPATVTSSFVQETVASEDEVAAAFENIQEIVPPDVLVIGSDTSGLFSTDEVIARQAADLQAAYEDYLTGHNHEYRATNTINNEACDLQNIPFESISYSLDAFGSAADAAAALEDEALAELNASEGFVANEIGSTGQTFYTKNESHCDMDMTVARTYWQRGHFVATVEITIPAAGAPELDLALESVGGTIYERFLSGILRPELR